MSRKTPDEWFSEYGECHQNATNKLIHWICIPAIMLSLLALLSEVPVPDTITRVVPRFNWAYAIMLVCLIFYLRLSISLAIGMALVSITCVLSIEYYTLLGLGPVWLGALIVFVVAWIGQFVGHKIEGKKPAFIDDLKFLLIGPLWLLGFIYRRLGIKY